jgi:hypothetical protein
MSVSSTLDKKKESFSIPSPSGNISVKSSSSNPPINSNSTYEFPQKEINIRNKGIIRPETSDTIRTGETYASTSITTTSDSIVGISNPSQLWTRDEEILLQEWSEEILGYAWLHERSSKYYQNQYMWLNIPAIALSTATGILIFSDLRTENIKIINGTLSWLSGALVSLQSYFKFEKKAEQHFQMYKNHTTHYHYIQSQLILPRENRLNPAELIMKVKKGMDENINSSPEIPEKVSTEFYKENKHMNYSKPFLVGKLSNFLKNKRGFIRRLTTDNITQSNPLSSPLQNPINSNPGNSQVLQIHGNTISPSHQLNLPLSPQSVLSNNSTIPRTISTANSSSYAPSTSTTSNSQSSTPEILPTPLNHIQSIMKKDKSPINKPPHGPNRGSDGEVIYEMNSMNSNNASGNLKNVIKTLEIFNQLQQENQQQVINNKPTISIINESQTSVPILQSPPFNRKNSSSVLLSPVKKVVRLPTSPLSNSPQIKPVELPILSSEKITGLQPNIDQVSTILSNLQLRQTLTEENLELLNATNIIDTLTQSSESHRDEESNNLSVPNILTGIPYSNTDPDLATLAMIVPPILTLNNSSGSNITTTSTPSTTSSIIINESNELTENKEDDFNPFSEIENTITMPVEEVVVVSINYPIIEENSQNSNNEKNPENK